jgi:hypothetical protein
MKSYIDVLPMGNQGWIVYRVPGTGTQEVDNTSLCWKRSYQLFDVLTKCPRFNIGNKIHRTGNYGILNIKLEMEPEPYLITAQAPYATPCGSSSATAFMCVNCKYGFKCTKRESIVKSYNNFLPKIGQKKFNTTGCETCKTNCFVSF